MDKSLEIMRILRVPPLGKLVVELGGKQFEKLEDVPDGRQRQMALAAIGELIAFGGSYQKLVDAGFAPPLAPPPPKQEEPMTAAQAAFLASLRGSEKIVTDPINLVRQLAVEGQVNPPAPPAAVAPPVPPPTPEPIPAPPPITPAATAVPPDPITQLNAILQKHLAKAPELNGQLIQLEAHNGGVQLNVNGTFYAKPSDVPDPLTRMIVKAARQEWDETRGR